MATLDEQIAEIEAKLREKNASPASTAVHQEEINEGTLDEQIAGVEAKLREKNGAPVESTPSDVIGDNLGFVGQNMRSVIEGVSAAPGGIYNAVGMIGEMHKLISPRPTWDPDTIDTKQYGTQFADALGLPKPTSPAAKIYHETLSGISEAALPMGLVGLLNKAKGATKGGEVLSKIVGSDEVASTIASVAAGSGAAEVARQGGASEMEQILYPLIAGTSAGAGVQMLPAAVRGSARVAAPILGKGSEGIAGRLLNRNAGPSSLEMLEKGNLPGLTSEIPNFNPTSTQITGDPWLAGISRAGENSNFDPGSILNSRSKNAAAIKKYTENATGTPESRQEILDGVGLLSQEMTNPMRQRNNPVNIDNVYSSLNRAIKKHEGNTGIVTGLERVKKNLPDTVKSNSSAIDPLTLTRTNIQSDLGFNEVLNAKQNIDEILRTPKIMADKKTMSVQKAKDALKGTKRELNKSLAEAEPEYMDTVTDQAVALKEYDQLVAADDLVTRSTGTSPLISNAGGVQTEVFPLQSNSMQRFLTNKKMLSSMNDGQFDILENARKASASQSRNNAGRATGSNTAQNLQMSQLIKDDVATTLAGSNDPGFIAKGLSNVVDRVTKYVSTGNNEQIYQLLIDADLDPALAARLMREHALGGKSTMTRTATGGARGALYSNDPRGY